MKIVIDTDARSLLVDEPNERTLPLYSKAAFEILSREWIRVGWNMQHWMGFSWLGYQLLQLPEDVLRLQEVVYKLRPDVVVETGVYRGGSTMLFASLCQLMDHGRVLSIERFLQPGLREVFASDPLGHRICLFEGDSSSAEIFRAVQKEAAAARSVLVFLDSNHSKAHVLEELELYSQLVTLGSYIVAADGVMRVLADTPNGDPDWREDNPAEAAREFAGAHTDFVLETPEPLFLCEGYTEELTYLSDAWLKRVAATERPLARGGAVDDSAEPRR